MKRIIWPLLLFVVLGVTFAQTQDVDSEDPASTDPFADIETLDDIETLIDEEGDPPAEEMVDDDSPEPAPTDVLIEDEAFDPLAELEAAEAAGDPAESMERFEPTERISEDRSVAFPNDI